MNSETNRPTLMPDFERVSTETVQSRVHGRLRELLMLGRFAPGHPLKIADLAEAMGTSAQPVRESIRQLVAERALEALPNRSARVPGMTLERLEDLRRVRLAIEGLAAELATERATAEDIDALRALMAVGIEADNSGAIDTTVQMNKRFHFALYAIAGSSTLLPFIESLWLQIGPIMRQSAAIFDGRGGRGNEMHARMVEGLDRRDKEAVREALADDISRSFNLLAKDLARTAERPAG
ncbi:GntR family transcriptional regulator [Paracoccus sp. S-4012]|uniref:GntR family transcriptional regulator n=1 Tax=Paracoccus sp. S-4012 TaxID=2665648 RepID=UPI0018A1B7DB